MGRKKAMPDTMLIALYRGEKFVDVGTVKEVMKKCGYSYSRLSWLSLPSVHKRFGQKNALMAYRIE